MRLIITLAILILAQMHRINSTPISFDQLVLLYICVLNNISFYDFIFSYKLVRLVPKTKEQIELIVKWEESSEVFYQNN